MTGSHYQRSPRVNSSSPQLKYPSNGSCSPQNGLQKPVRVLQRGLTSPVKSGKKRNHAVISPVTTKYESYSPKAKSRLLSSPVSSSVSSNVSGEKDRKNRVNAGSSPAVPKVSAEPPSALSLPSPPVHWVTSKGSQCLAQKQQCRMVTEGLVTHLASSGILISAQ